MNDDEKHKICMTKQYEEFCVIYPFCGGCPYETDSTTSEMRYK